MPINLQLFCWLGETHRYPGITKPFRIGKWLYATDGRVCVRIPADKEARPTKKVPLANDLFRKFKAEACTEPWPEWDGARCYANCPDCGSKDIEQIASQIIAERKIGGLYWLKIASLGKVLYDPRGTADDALHFVCGDLQGLLMPI